MTIDWYFLGYGVSKLALHFQVLPNHFLFLQFFFHFIYKILLGKIQLQGKKYLEAKIKTGKILN